MLWAIIAYNCETWYVWGTKAEAYDFAEYLNKGRTVNHYTPFRISRSGFLSAGHREDAILNLNDELAAIEGLR